jgi:hypothetical protein
MFCRRVQHGGPEHADAQHTKVRHAARPSPSGATSPCFLYHALLGKAGERQGCFECGLCQQRFERCVCWSIDCSPSELPSESPSEFPSARCAAL